MFIQHVGRAEGYINCLFFEEKSLSEIKIFLCDYFTFYLNSMTKLIVIFAITGNQVYKMLLTLYMSTFLKTTSKNHFREDLLRTFSSTLLAGKFVALREILRKLRPKI
jgi:hypothetical protein